MAGLRRISVNSFGASGTNAHVVLDDTLNHLREQNLEGNHCTKEDPASTTIPYMNGNESAECLQLHGHNSSKESFRYTALPRLIILSAFDKPVLKRVIELHLDWMEKNKSTIKANPEVLQDLAYTLLERRSLLRYRSFAVVDEADAFQAGGPHFSSPVRIMNQPRVAFTFTGQGAQWAGMGRDMFHFPVFYDAIREAGAYLRELGVDWDLIGMKAISS
jgi:acyl transferase domain-containing protein